jgi:hypothetical protein
MTRREMYAAFREYGRYPLTWLEQTGSEDERSVITRA